MKLKLTAPEIASAMDQADDVPPVLIPLAYDRAGLAMALSVSVSLIDAMNAKGAIPTAVDLSGRCPRWARREIEAWLLAGSPTRARWTAIRDQILRKYT